MATHTDFVPDTMRTSKLFAPPLNVPHFSDHSSSLQGTNRQKVQTWPVAMRGNFTIIVMDF